MRLRLAWFVACLAMAVSYGWAQGPPPGPNDPLVAVRIAYLVDEGVPVHVHVGDVGLVDTLAPGSVTSYRLAVAGEQEITVFDASDEASPGPGPGAAPTVATKQHAWEEGGYATIVLVDRGTLGGSADGSGSSTSPFDVHVFEDHLTTFPSAGQASIRLVNLWPGVASRSVRATVPEDQREPDEAGPESIGLADAVPFAQTGVWTSVPLGFYRIAIGAQGDEASEASVEVALHGGTLYTLFVVAGPDDDAARITVHVDAVVRAAPGVSKARPGDAP